MQNQGTKFYLLLGLCLVAFFSPVFLAAENARHCFPELRTVGVARESENSPSAQAKVQYFNKIADVIENHRSEIKKILTKVDTVAGADYEINQSLQTLRGVETIELHNLEKTRRLNNVAVYGSTNIPLYTLVLHGFVPASVSDNVWFRTPQATREIYQELYQFLESKLPPGSLSNLHVLTEAKDVQYDKFRKRFVLGMNQKGTKFERTPSEVVLFTGNPETGREILESNQTKIAENQSQLGAFRQIFLGFGAGMNPLIVTSAAKNNLGPAVDATLESIRINCGQDCIAPNFYLIHNNVAPNYLKQLTEKIADMRAGPREDPKADYSPLTLTQDLSKLTAYRNKYEQYLVNKEAILDPEKNLASPHVFSFPISMFAEVDLQEHYGPFITLFTYNSNADVEKASKDPRVQKKVMYASVYGDSKATFETANAIELLQQNRHGVSANASVYADESGNMPFGGAGSDAAIVATLDVTPGKKIKIHEAHRPILFSEETRLAFGKQVNPVPPVNPRSFYADGLSSLLSEATASPQTVPLPYDWSTLKSPQVETRKTGIKALQEVIKREGLSKVLLRNSPHTPQEVHAMEDFYGTKLIFAHDLPVSPYPAVSKTGVVLHPSNVGSPAEVLNTYRGRVNPHLGKGVLLGLLDGDKKKEFVFAEAIDPGVMPPTEIFFDLVKAKRIGSDFFDKQMAIAERLRSLLKKGIALSPKERTQLKSDLRNLAETFFRDVRKRFPEGAYIKNFDEFATGDLGNLITSFSSNPSRLADQFLLRFEKALSKGSAPSLSDERVQKVLLEDDYDTATKFLNTLIRNPKNLLAQGRVDIARTEMGFNQEFRVSFIDGEPVIARNRFSHEYLPEELEKSKEVLKKFFDKAPPEAKYLSGGADVARLNDGRWVIIEFNFGSADGTLSPQNFPIESHQFVATLQGKNTAFLEKLETAYKGGLESQRRYLQSLSQEKELWNKFSFEDLSVTEVGRFFRNKLLDEWRKNPSEESAKEIRAKIDQLFQGIGTEGNEEIRNLVRGADYYIKRRLAGP